MRTIATIILIFFSINAIAQFAFNYDDFEIEPHKKNIHRIIQTEKGAVTRIEEYDSLGRIIFSYSTLYGGENWNMKYIFYLRAYVYDKKGRVIIRYDLNSNVGLSVSYYHYDSLGNKTTYYYNFQNHRSDQINTNPYHRISEYKNYSDLIASSEVEMLNNKIESALLSSKEFYDNGKIVEEIHFNNDGSIDWEKEYKYDKDRISKENSYWFVEGKKKLSRIFTREYKSDTSFFEILVNVKQNSPQDTIFHIYEIFNSQNKIIVKRTFEKEEIKEWLYFYNSEGRLSYIDYDVHDRFGNEEYDYPYGNRKERKTYKYNRQGLVKSETILEHSPKNREKRKYKYKIEYY